MLFDVLTGILSVCFIVLCFLYPFRRKLKAIRKVSTLKIHCIGGCLLLLVTLIHINFKILDPTLSAGFVALAVLILVAITGILKRRFMKNKILYVMHLLFVGIFVLTLLVHIAQNIINLLLM